MKPRLAVTAIAAFLIGLSCVVPIASANMGSLAIQLRCAEIISSPTAPIPGFVGTYVYTSRLGITDIEHIWELGVIEDQGERKYRLPLNAELSQQVFFPSVSPDGSKISFRPFMGDDLIVVNTVTGEIAKFALSENIAEYLRQTDSSRLAFKKIEWESSRELVIQDLEVAPFSTSHSYTLNVLESPLQIASGSPISEFVLSQNGYPQDSPLLIPSPNGGYVVQINGGLSDPSLTQLKVVDSNGHELVHTVPSQERQIASRPRWLNDQRYMFYLEKSHAGLRLVLLDEESGFARSTQLDEALKSAFGSSTGISSTFPPIVSVDGTTLAFGYFDQNDNEYFLISYNPLTGETIAVCDDPPVSSDIYPFWSPSSRFAAYWYSGFTRVYDFSTGSRYVLPGRGFAGWVADFTLGE